MRWYLLGSMTLSTLAALANPGTTVATARMFPYCRHCRRRPNPNGVYVTLPSPERLDAAIDVRELSRVYRPRGTLTRSSSREIVALAGLDLAVQAGEVHGLLGPNGAGKSTLCKILATVLMPTSGSARVLGFDVVRDKQRIRERLALVLGGEGGLYSRLTARQNLRFWAALYGVRDRDAQRKADMLLDQVGLAERADDRVETFSRGMKQRLHLARGLLSDPSVILLDEPTSGMDPVATRQFHAVIGQIRAERTVLLATHDMVEAELLCDRVTIIDQGKMLAMASPATLATWITRFERIDVRELSEAVADKARALSGVGRVGPGPDGGTRIETVAEGATAAVLRLLLDHDYVDVRTSLPSLEEVYLHLLDPAQSEAQ
jgi:ABC-2 type transport system ATP-binding protein